MSKTYKLSSEQVDRINFDNDVKQDIEAMDSTLTMFWVWWKEAENNYVVDDKDEAMYRAKDQWFTVKREKGEVTQCSHKGEAYEVEHFLSTANIDGGILTGMLEGDVFDAVKRRQKILLNVVSIDAPSIEVFSKEFWKIIRKYISNKRVEAFPNGSSYVVEWMEAKEFTFNGVDVSISGDKRTGWEVTANGETQSIRNVRTEGGTIHYSTTDQWLVDLSDLCKV